MRQRPRDALESLLVGIGVAAGLARLTGRFSVAFTTGLCWTVGVTLFVRHRYPTYITGEEWVDKRWTGLAVGVLTFAALLGVAPMLPVTDELRFALGLLVLGVGFTACTAGTLAVFERTELDPSATDPIPDAGDN
ncbi:MAG: sterol desaturase [Halobellus sp.]|uniref:sterol desaturase n=1 Tax=Halobellus sp. TaxID=1979212 RepID=UPI0035D40EFA